MSYHWKCLQCGTEVYTVWNDEPLGLTWSDNHKCKFVYVGDPDE